MVTKSSLKTMETKMLKQQEELIKTMMDLLLRKDDEVACMATGG